MYSILPAPQNERTVTHHHRWAGGRKHFSRCLNKCPGGDSYQKHPRKQSKNITQCQHESNGCFFCFFFLCCRVRVICYGELRWTPWMPWGSWLWPVKPVDSSPPPPTPHPLPFLQLSVTTPPTPCLPAKAAHRAMDASDAHCHRQKMEWMA